LDLLGNFMLWRGFLIRETNQSHVNSFPENMENVIRLPYAI
jgi:hypothetical protein